ncbi:MAG: hypothetical protein H6742_11770 [Alphaproteobacteria bacterium]|nr:hypothetical protein [Alphaproteobacteria bacterium]
MRPLPAAFLLSLPLLCAACAPPPLPGGDTGSSGSGDNGEPSVRIVFPFTSSSVTICPEFVMVLDIDNFDVVDFNGTTDVPADEGHWHLFDGSDYLTNFVEEWGLVQLDHEGAGAEPHILTVQLALNDHSLLDYESTIEIEVDNTEDCLGGDHGPPPSSDGGDDTGAR